jgi:gliding motility-associated protein GldM
MAGGKISPRQKMINMMYLVLTALLALNVSKEVLNSFFEVNKGITRTTINFNAKNSDTYAAFDAAAEVNPVKAGPFREQAYSVKNEADKLVVFLQEMKYNLVLKADKKVYLGSETEIKDKDGDLLDDKAILLTWDLLSEKQKSMNIGALSNKDDRNSSGDLFYNNKLPNNIATDLKNDLNAYKNLLLGIAEGNESLITSINETCNYDDKKVKGKKQLWEEYNFYDMPSVGALTLLSKMQSDVRNTESDIINMLRENIDAGSLKFTSAEGIQIPNSNFILKGDSFRAQIFIAAKDTTQAPLIYVGEYDSLGGGNYKMIGNDYETVKIVNGKGMFSKRANSLGSQKWGGLIAMKTDNGTKMYPFSGEYLVAAKTAVVSPTKMNVLYIGLDSYGGNPLQVSVPGYSAGEISAVLTGGGSVKATSKVKGQWAAYPTKVGKAKVSLFVKVGGKRTKMGDIDFRVMRTPPPSPFVLGIKNGRIDRATLLASGGILASLDNFVFDGLKYYVTSFKLSGQYQGEKVDRTNNNGMNFTKQMRGVISNSKSGDEIQITKIKAKLIGSNEPPININDLVIEIK